MKKLIAVLVALIALACLAGCGFAIDWIWMVKKPTIDKTTYAFDRAEDVLDIAHKTIDDVKGNLEVSRAMYLIQMTQSSERNGVQSLLARTVVKQVSPDINDAQRTVEKVTEASIVVNSILESLHALDNFEAFDPKQVRSLQTQVGGVTKASVDLGNLLDTSKAGAGEQSARVVAGLEDIIHRATEFQKSTKALQSKVQQYKDRTLYWMNLAPTLATIALGWVAVSQLIVIVAMIRVVRRKADPQLN
jgi:hypothetical protein